MECRFFGEGENAFFTYDSIDNHRIIPYPIYPKPFYNLLDNKNLKYTPKNIDSGEKRFVTIDIATMAGKQNDASAYIIFQLIPKNGQYIRNIIYMESMVGGHTVDQAIRIRQLCEDFECDYIVLDTLNAGIGVFDMLVQDLVDESRFLDGAYLTYPALTCMNDSKMSERCKSLDAEAIIYSVKGNQNFNSECALRLRDALRRGKIKLLVNENDGRKLLNKINGFVNIPHDEQLMFELPYIQIRELINEMVNLDYETNNGLIKVKEISGMRKDRYSALTYGNYFANFLEQDLRSKVSDYEYKPLYN